MWNILDKLYFNDYIVAMKGKSKINGENKNGGNQMIKFIVGKEYNCRSVCDHNCIWSFIVEKRTDKNIWIKVDGELVRRKIDIYKTKKRFILLENIQWHQYFQQAKRNNQINLPVHRSTGEGGKWNH